MTVKIIVVIASIIVIGILYKIAVFDTLLPMVNSPWDFILGAILGVLAIAGDAKFIISVLSS